MIRLDFVLQSKMEQKQVVDAFYQKLVNGRNKSYLQSIDLWCKTYLKIEPDKEEEEHEFPYFEHVVKADYHELKKIKETITQKHISFGKLRCGYLQNTLYNGLDKKDFARQIGISVCPYCNRNFVNASQKGGDFQLDHFFDKASWPVFSVSFYNLVPVCGSCNYKKMNSQFQHSPYDPDFGTDELVTFSYLPKSIHFIHDQDEMDIVMKYPHKKILKKDMDILDMENLYQIHKDRVIDIIKQKIIYSEEYVEEIVRTNPGLFKDAVEVQQLYLGGYVEEREYGKRPLSKFVADIGREMEFIGRK